MHALSFVGVRAHVQVFSLVKELDSETALLESEALPFSAGAIARWMSTGGAFRADAGPIQHPASAAEPRSTQGDGSALAVDPAASLLLVGSDADGVPAQGYGSNQDPSAVDAADTAFWDIPS